jgi:hypothetical protein
MKPHETRHVLTNKLLSLSNNSVLFFIAGFYFRKPSVPCSRVLLEKLTSLTKQQFVVTHRYTEGRYNMTDPYWAYTYVKVKVKVKLMFTLEQATKAQKGSRGIALLFL